MQVRQELAARIGEIASLNAERQSLRDELGAARARVAELENAARGESDLRRQQADVHAKVVAGLRARLAELEESTARMQELEFKIEDLVEKLAGRDAQIGALQEQLVTLPPPSAGDDLKNIRGIGPKYEKSLRSLGITTYRQIAEWTEADVVSVAEKLKVRPERIVRDDWVGRARRLLEG